MERTKVSQMYFEDIDQQLIAVIRRQQALYIYQVLKLDTSRNAL